MAIPQPPARATDPIRGATSGQLGLWLGLGVLWMWLGFRRGKGWGWRILGVIGVLNVLLSLGEIARRIGRTNQGAPPAPVGG